MSRPLTQYRVFIGSPGGLQAEREQFRDTIDRFNMAHGKPAGVLFEPVGWEDTLPSRGRPQEQINTDLQDCDYAVFVWYDYWGMPTGTCSSGTEEEWIVAQDRTRSPIMRNVCLFFKSVDDRQKRSPGPQLKKVLAFRRKIEAARKHLYKSYDQPGEFVIMLERLLADWLRQHSDSGTGSGAMPNSGPTLSLAGPTPPLPDPGFSYSLAESWRLAVPGNDFNPPVALYFAERALVSATGDVEWAKAENARGVARFHLNDLPAAKESFQAIVDRLANATDSTSRELVAQALFNKAVTLEHLGYNEEAIATYDAVLARFGIATESTLRGLVAMALVNKGIRLGHLGRGDEEIATYDNVLALIGNATEPALRVQVVMALVNKGIRLGHLGRGDEEIAAYDDMFARFGNSMEPALREAVAKALVNKGFRLGHLGRGEEEIVIYDDVLARFGGATELSLREQIAMALVNKGFRLGFLGRGDEEISTEDDVLARFGTATEPVLRAQVARALVNKGVRLGQIGRNVESVHAHDEVLTRFGNDTEIALREAVVRALVNKGIALRDLARHAEANATFDAAITRFGSATEPQILAFVEQARKLRG